MTRSKRMHPVSPGSPKSDPVRAARFLGCTPDDLIGKCFPDLVKLHHRSVPLDSPARGDAPHAPDTLLTLERRDQSLVDVIARDVRNVAPGMCLRILREMAAEAPLIEALEKKTRLLEATERVGRIGAWEIDVDAGLVVRIPEMCRIMEVTATDQLTSIEDSYRYYTESSRGVCGLSSIFQLQPAVPKDSTLVAGRKWLRGFFSIGQRKSRLSGHS